MQKTGKLSRGVGKQDLSAGWSRKVWLLAHDAGP